MKYTNKFSFKKINKKNFIKTIFISLIIILVIVFLSLYIANINFRNFVDIKILKKTINSSNSTSINFSDDESNSVFAYDKYIAILNKNNFYTYTSSGNKSFDLTIELNNPIYSSCNKFICLAEKGGQNIYLINDQNIAWQKSIEGEISKISVNKNGYVAVIVSGTSYKSIIITYNPNGKELFRTYLSTTIAIDTAISNNNKYLSIAEIDYSGTSIQSNIKILSFDKAQTNPTEAVEYIYPASSNSIVTCINYNSKNKLVCMYDNSIHVIQNNSDSELANFSEKGDLFFDTNLSDTYIKVSDKPNGLFSGIEVHLVDVNTNKDSIYALTSTPKSIYCDNKTIALNLGSEIHFINDSAWLIKKYTTTQEAKDIVIGNGIAGIVYKNKIEIINL